MTGKQLQDYARKYLLRDDNLPPLWDNALLLQLLNEGQELFCRDTHHSLSATTLDLVAIEGESDVVLPDSVVTVHSLRIAGDTRPLRCYPTEKLPYSDAEAKPYAYAMDEAQGVVRLYPTPDADYNLVVRAATVPEPFTASTEPAIPARYHTLLAYYAAAQCLMQNEVDGENTAQAVAYERKWGRGLVEAKREYYLRRTGPMPVARPPVSFTGKRN